MKSQARYFFGGYFPGDLLAPLTFFPSLFLTGCFLWTSYRNLLFFVQAITSQMMLQGWYPQQNEAISSSTQTQRTAQAGL